MNINEILQTVLGNNTSKIKEAEENLKLLAEQNFGNLLIELASILSDEGSSIQKRQLCASIIKNSINTNLESINKWMTLPTEIKKTIKNYVLSTLASEINNIRKSASLAVAGKLFNSLINFFILKKAIASVELPYNEWHDIITTLIHTSTLENVNFKISSIITIGYISQEVSPQYLFPVEKRDLLDSILNILETENNKEILLNATSSLLYLIPHSRSNIEFDVRKFI